MNSEMLMAMCRKNGGGVVFTPALHVETYWGITHIFSMCINVKGALVICDNPRGAYRREPEWDDLDAPTQRDFYEAIKNNVKRDKNLF